MMVVAFQVVVLPAGIVVVPAVVSFRPDIAEAWRARYGHRYARSSRSVGAGGHWCRAARKAATSVSFAFRSRPSRSSMQTGRVTAIRAQTRDGDELGRFMLDVLRRRLPGTRVRDRMAAGALLKPPTKRVADYRYVTRTLFVKSVMPYTPK